MKRILVPCDFSHTAQQAYTFALDIAKKIDGEIFVLRAIEVPFMYESYSTTVPVRLNPEQWGKIVEEATVKFTTMKASHTRQADITFRVVEGPVVTTILDFIQQENIDLVVMGTKGASGLDEFFVGSNTEKIVRLAKAPVMAVRKAVNISSIRNIVVPTMLQLDQSDFITKLKELQALFGATLQILVVNTPHNFKRTKYELKELESYAKHYQLRDYSLHIRGDFTEEAGILSFVDEIHADMVAIATHGRRGLAHLFMGSITENIINRAEYPMWTYSLRK